MEMYKLKRAYRNNREKMKDVIAGVVGTAVIAAGIAGYLYLDHKNEEKIQAKFRNAKTIEHIVTNPKGENYWALSIKYAPKISNKESAVEVMDYNMSLNPKQKYLHFGDKLTLITDEAR